MRRLVPVSEPVPLIAFSKLHEFPAGSVSVRVTSNGTFETMVCAGEVVVEFGTASLNVQSRLCIVSPRGLVVSTNLATVPVTKVEVGVQLKFTSG